jgi:glutathione peroxidase-family protein
MSPRNAALRHYTDNLQELFEAFKEHLIEAGFSADNSGGQKSGAHKEIRAFCTARYSVTLR